MSDKTKIEWTDASWNIITGCTVLSKGCTNCYAMRLAGTRLKHHPSRKGLTNDSNKGPVWNGEVRFNDRWLTQPLRWTKPRRIFVCAHGDLFHENVKDGWLDQIFAVMVLCPRHTFQILTKRPERMRDYISNCSGRVFFKSMQIDHPTNRNITLKWPLEQVWLGVSVEDQKTANERIPLLLDTPAAVRWVSAEPLLGSIDLTEIGHYRAPHSAWWDSLRGAKMTGSLPRSPNECGFNTSTSFEDTKLDWVVVGGESGPEARPMHPDWARSLRDQCKAANVPFFFKQNGEFVSVSEARGHGGPYTFPDGVTVRRAGKKLAGHLLDGEVIQQYPGDSPE